MWNGIAGIWQHDKGIAVGKPVVKNGKLVVKDKDGKEISDHKYDKDDDKFKIPWFRIMNGEAHGDKRSVIEKGYSAEPFFTREQAEKQIENLKKQTSDEKFPFNPNELEIEECDEYDQFELSLAQLIEYIEEFGIKFNLPEFLEQKKGAIAAKKFGF